MQAQVVGKKLVDKIKMIESNGYFYNDLETVYFRTSGVPIFHVRVCSTDYPEQAQRMAAELNRDLKQLDHLPRATREHHPGRSFVF